MCTPGARKSYEANEWRIRQQDEFQRLSGKTFLLIDPRATFSLTCVRSCMRYCTVCSHRRAQSCVMTCYREHCSPGRTLETANSSQDQSTRKGLNRDKLSTAHPSSLTTPLSVKRASNSCRLKPPSAALFDTPPLQDTYFPASVFCIDKPDAIDHRSLGCHNTK